MHGDTSHTLCWGYGTCLRARGPKRIAVPGGWTAWGQREDPNLCAARQGQGEQGTRGPPHCCNRRKRRSNRVRTSVTAQDSRACRCKRHNRSNLLDRQRLNTDSRIIIMHRTSRICALFSLPFLPCYPCPRIDGDASTGNSGHSERGSVRALHQSPARTSPLSSGKKPRGSRTRRLIHDTDERSGWP